MFLYEPCLTFLKEYNYQKARLESEFVWEEGETIIVVPSFFITDGGSIPKRLWRFYGPPFRSPYLPGYIVHDYECQIAREYMEAGMASESREKRLEGDKRLRCMALHLGASQRAARHLYWGVRIGAKASGF